jgi:hypothetical protein
MAYKIVTTESKTFTAEDIVASVGSNNDGTHVYYMFLGKHTTYEDNSDNPSRPLDSESYKRQVYRDMLFGKKINAGDMRIMVDRVDYVANTVYDMYDDTDRSLQTKNFFVNVVRGNERDVFKCLSNYNGAMSTEPPDKNDIGSFDEIYRTSDGYVWKYMYTVPYADMEKFGTDAYIPVVPNTSVSTSANNGSIDVVMVESGGEGYKNYLYGTLGKNDLNINGDFKKIDVSANNLSSTFDDYYAGCIFKVVSGTGAGLYSRIESYDVYGNSRVVTISSTVGTINTPGLLDITSEYEITPEVRIVGDFTQTVNAMARAIINSTANTIDYVEILNKGLDYKQATAYVYSSNVVPVTSNSVVRPIIGPFGGHGYDANNELGATRACFSITFKESVDSLPSVNDFRQVGIISDPFFSNVTINFSTKGSASFITDETVYQVNPIRMFGEAVTVNTSSNSVSADTAFFDELDANTIIYIEGSSSQQLATVVGITNSTYITIDTPGNFACNDCKIYLANVSNPTVVVNDLYDGVALRNVSKYYGSGERLVGYDSGATGIVNNMVVSDKTTTLGTFTQMWRYVVNTNGEFEADEVIYQPNSAANSHGRLFGLVEDGANSVMYLSDQFGYINTGDNVFGLTSEDRAYVATSYEPDLVHDSGRLIYIENLEKVDRDPDQKETFKIIFSY